MKALILSVGAIAAIALGTATATNARSIKDPSTPEARAALADASACIVRSSAEEAAALLRMDFRTAAYRSKMQRLAENNIGCFKERWLRAQGLLVAGGLAEQLLSRSQQKTNIRLAMLPAESAITPRTPTDAVAFCVARSDPDGVARLFSTPVATAEETAAAMALNVALTRCNQTGKDIAASAAGARAMLATATYRLLEGQED